MTEHFDGAARTADQRIEQAEASSRVTDHIPVFISYDIIRLFSEGLYQSPQKAIEELVSNGYDAGAKQVHVIVPPLPPSGDDGDVEDSEDSAPSATTEEVRILVESQEPTEALWVIDNGVGMDAEGFTNLWRVARSVKADVSEGARLPIGQFGIGKLAAYVLAWRLTHLSRVDGVIRMTSMNFRLLQRDDTYNSRNPIDLDLRVVSEEDARAVLAEVQDRDPVAWDLMFGASAKNWTAAGLSDFKTLFEKLAVGRLSWVLRTGLPLQSEFQIYLDGEELESSKESLQQLASFTAGGESDPVVASINAKVADGEEAQLKAVAGGVEIRGITGVIKGRANLYLKKLTEGKSDQYGRSNGFFIKVRGRIINLEDALFGLPALNHSVWSRFSMVVEADGLRDHLLSSREGVRESDAIGTLRKYLVGCFNQVRRAWEDQQEKEVAGLDVEKLLNDAPSAYVSDPLRDSVSAAIDQESYYIDKPEIPVEKSVADWLAEFGELVAKQPIAAVDYEATGPYSVAIRYHPDSRRLVINTEHPYMDKLITGSRSRGPATLFGSAELMVDVLLQEHGVHRAAINDFLRGRDRVLRLLAGEEPSSATEVLRMLKTATSHSLAQERAVGMAFRVLGFEYERRGGNDGGTDGVLYARLGRGTSELADYKVVYDSKQTNAAAVPAKEVRTDSLNDFKKTESAHFGFFVAVAYDGQATEDSKVNKLIRESVALGIPATLLTIKHLHRLVEIHYRHGITLTQLRQMFETCHHTYDIDAWISALEAELSQGPQQVPVLHLLETLEALKGDPLATPNVNAARQRSEALIKFEPERLIAALDAVAKIVSERWIEVDRGGDVRLHHTAHQILARLDYYKSDIFADGVNPTKATKLS